MPLPVRLRRPSVDKLNFPRPAPAQALGMRRNDSACSLRGDRFALILARSPFRVKRPGGQLAGFAIRAGMALIAVGWGSLEVGRCVGGGRAGCGRRLGPALARHLRSGGVGAGHQSPIANLLWGIAARPVGVTSKPLHIGAHPGTVIPQSSKWATCTVGATVTRVCRAFERFIHQSRCNHACNSAQPRWLAFDAAVGSGLGNLNDSGGH